MEVTRHTALTDKMALHYFELPKLPKITEIDADDEIELWLSAINAKTEEQLSTIKAKGGRIMAQLVDAYHNVAGLSEVQEMIRLRERAQHDEASALAFAKREGQRAVAAKMKAEGVSIDVILKWTDLTVEEVLQL